MQFCLSPALNPSKTQLLGEKNKAWKKASLLEKLANVEVAEDCLMPDGPCCTMVSLTSSEIWRCVVLGDGWHALFQFVCQSVRKSFLIQKITKTLQLLD